MTTGRLETFLKSHINREIIPDPRPPGPADLHGNHMFLIHDRLRNARTRTRAPASTDTHAFSSSSLTVSGIFVDSPKVLFIYYLHNKTNTPDWPLMGKTETICCTSTVIYSLFTI